MKVRGVRKEKRKTRAVYILLLLLFAFLLAGYVTRVGNGRGGSSYRDSDIDNVPSVTDVILSTDKFGF